MIENTAVHFSKQNSTSVAEFNSNLKISGGGGGMLTLLNYHVLRDTASKNMSKNKIQECYI